MAPPNIVTDPTKIVTDPVVLKRLLEQSIDYRFVEFSQDYDIRSHGPGRSPYCKTYRDLISGKRLMVSQGLPMVDAFGFRPELTWISKEKNIYTRPNLFYAETNKRQVRLVCLSDQPYGAKKDDEVSWMPQLFVGGSEVYPVSDTPILLETDPTNPNLHFNVLEFDYGVCKRWLRLVQGVFQELWAFYSNPNAEIRIDHNQIGKIRFNLAPFGVSDDRKVISTEAFTELVEEHTYPIIIGGTLTVYPDADPETTSVDGYTEEVYVAGTNKTWAQMVAGLGTGAVDNAAGSSHFVTIRSDTGTDKWRIIRRSPLLFDTSPLGATAIPLAGVLSLYSSTKADELSITPDIVIVASLPASNTALVAGDFNSHGATAFSNVITYAGFADGAYNDFTLDATGRAAISLTDISKFGARNSNYDISGTPPAWTSNVYSALRGYFAEEGAGFKPKLVVTYGEAHTKSLSDTLSISDSIVKAASLVKAEAALTISDSLVKSAGKNTSDSLAITDSHAKAAGKAQSDTLNVTDSLSKGVGKAETDTLSITDSIIKAAGKILADTMAITDSIVKTMGGVIHTLAFFDTMTITDSFSATLERCFNLRRQVARLAVKRMKIGRIVATCRMIFGRF